MDRRLESLRRILCLWQGDALRDVREHWAIITDQTSDPAVALAMIEGLGEGDAGFRVEADTLAEMRTIVAQLGDVL